MRMRRFNYAIFVAITIVLGLLSRKINGIPLAIGDALYAIMIYWLMRFFFIHRSKTFCLLLSFGFCCTIETLQLVDLPLLVWARNHPFLRLILGQGFLWSDIIAYLIGVMVAFLIEYKFYRSK